MRKTLFHFIIAIAAISCTSESSNNSKKIAKLDPLPSWNSSPQKQVIIDFVTKVTDPSSKDFVAESERIAVFDNDGTLWCEQPTPEIVYHFDVYVNRVQNDPKLQTADALALIKKGREDILSLTVEDIIKISAQTYFSSPDEASEHMKQWIDTATHYRFEKKYTDLVYVPMLEVLEYLEDNGFKNYIVSGGSNVFMRTFAEQVYNIPPERIIGTMQKASYIEDSNKIELAPDLWVWNDKGAKVASIFQLIGRKPIFAFGNSDGDYQMLEWTASNSLPHISLLLNHTDMDREYQYGGNEKGLTTGKSNGWIIVDMKKDFKKVFSSEED